MKPVWQIPRQSLYWLLVSVVAVIGLHFSHLPLWLSLAGVLACLWQVQLFRERWSHPGAFVRWMLALSCLAGLIVAEGRFGTLESMVGLLFVGYILKMLEVHRRRDVLILIHISYLLVVIHALFDQTPVAGLLVILGLLPVTASLAALYQRGAESPARPLAKSMVIALQALPLMVVLFVVMPRAGSLWAVPRQGSGTTGVSDSMSPGDMSHLGRNAAVAFRVSFDGERPAQRELYWRGLVLSEFDGRRWTQADPWSFGKGAYLQWPNHARKPWMEEIRRDDEVYDYTVTLESTNAPWLFALPSAQPETEGIALSRDYRLVNRKPVVAKFAYRVVSWPIYQHSAGALDDGIRARETRLPLNSNPRTQALGQSWRVEGLSTTEMLDRALALFHREFTYTLQPPKLGEHTADEFLWDTKRGFCEHFAGSFVILMRAAGVPARVVVGYQGGEWHPNDDYLLVHQYDAHAWAEVWMPERGWVRVDPTAAVAPERIESSFADMFGDEDEFLADAPFNLARFRHIGWLNQMRLQLDALDYTWSKWVLGYDDSQQELLTDLLGRADWSRIGLFTLFGSLVALVPVLLMVYRSRPKPAHDPLDWAYLEFCSRLQKIGIPRHNGEGAADFAHRATGLRDDLGPQILGLTERYQRARYDLSDPRALAEEADTFRRAVRKFKPKSQRP